MSMKKSKKPKAKSQKKRAKKADVRKTNAQKITDRILKPGGAYKIKIEMSGDIFKTTSDDLMSAFLDFRPDKITGKLIITVEAENGRKFSRHMLPMQARRVFGGGNMLALEIFVKNTMMMTA